MKKLNIPSKPCGAMTCSGMTWSAGALLLLIAYASVFLPQSVKAEGRKTVQFNALVIASAIINKNLPPSLAINAEADEGGSIEIRAVRVSKDITIKIYTQDVSEYTKGRKDLSSTLCSMQISDTSTLMTITIHDVLQQNCKDNLMFTARQGKRSPTDVVRLPVFAGTAQAVALGDTTQINNGVKSGVIDDASVAEWIGEMVRYTSLIRGIVKPKPEAQVADVKVASTPPSIVSPSPVQTPQP